MARRFNGTTQAMSTAQTLDLRGYTTLSLSFWLWWNAFANDDELAMESSPNFNSNAGGILVDPNEAAGAFAFNVRDAAVANTATVNFTRPSAGVWHHYLATFNLSGAIAPAGNSWVEAVYVDGVSQTLTVTGTSSSVPTGFGNYTWYLMSRAAASLFGAGRMCEVALWPGVMLAAAEAQLLAGGARASQVRPGSLLEYWPLYGDLNPDASALDSDTRLIATAAPPVIGHAPVIPAVPSVLSLVRGASTAAPPAVFPPRPWITQPQFAISQFEE